MLTRMRRTDPWCSHALLGECKVVQLLWESIGNPHKTKHVVTIWPRNCTPGHFPGKWKLLFTQNTTEMITVDLFVIAPNGDNQNVPHKGMAKNPWSIHSMDPYNNKEEQSTDTCDNLRGNRRERGWVEKSISRGCLLDMAKLWSWRTDWWFFWDEGGRRKGSSWGCKITGVLVMEFSCILTVMLATWIYACDKIAKTTDKCIS